MFVNSNVLLFLILFKEVLLLGRNVDEIWERDLCVCVLDGNDWSYKVFNLVFKFMEVCGFFEL